MPESPGKKSLQKNAKNNTASGGKRGVLNRQKVLSRTKALRQVKQLLTQQNTIPDEAIDLIALFHLQCDDLTEAGVPYEMVRAVEKRYPLLLTE